MNTAAIYAIARQPDATAQLQQELDELRKAARAYFTLSDLITLTRDGVEAANKLARLLESAP